jgi:hypothetical protein
VLVEFIVCAVGRDRRRYNAEAPPARAGERLASRWIEEYVPRGITAHYTTDERNLAACAGAKALGLVHPIVHEWVVLRARRMTLLQEVLRFSLMYDKMYDRGVRCPL